MTTLVAADVHQNEHSTVSWGAVIGGGFVSAALALFLAALGVGLGLSSISPWNDQGVSATTFSVGAGIYIVCASMLANAVGGYLAGRLRHTWAGVHNDEIYFRDTAHGALSWAFALVLGATVLGAATTHLLAGASAGLIPAAGAGAANSAQSQPTDVYVDTLLRADPNSGNTNAQTGIGGNSNAGTNAGGGGSRNEVSRVVAPVLSKGGTISAEDRTYLVKVVSARTGLSQPEAEKRVDDTIAKAKKAADDARKAAAKTALWLAASMLAGALAAMLGATEGGVLRDSKWYEPGWRAITVRNH
jgi:hypothetical protein